MLLALGACGEDENGAAPTPSPAASASTAAPSSASPSPTTAKVVPSTNLSRIDVQGSFGETPKVTVKAPWAVDKTRAQVLQPGKGATVEAGQTVEVNYYGLNGRTGKKFDDSFSRKQSVAFSLAQVVPGFQKGLVGQRQGSRVLIAMPGKDGYDSAGGNPQIDVRVGDSLIFVVDVVGVQLAAPQGAKVPPKAGLPTVREQGGKPVVTVPKTNPPITLQVQPLIKGTGKKIGADDTITFDYVWVAWKDGRVLESTYESKPANYQLSGLLPGMAKGLAGQQVGSRVLLVIPPAQAYPNGNANPKVDPGETLVMVVDLLFTQATQ